MNQDLESNQPKKTKRPIGCFGWGAIIIFGLWALGSIFPDNSESTSAVPAISSSPTAAAPTAAAPTAAAPTAAAPTAAAPTAAAPTAAAPTAAAAPTESTALKNAKRLANSYLKSSSFSKSGLIEQLIYEGFDEATATLAVNSLTSVDWNEQAALLGASYLKISGFSRSGLIEQLEYEGFTNSEATYGAEANGL